MLNKNSSNRNTNNTEITHDIPDKVAEQCAKNGEEALFICYDCVVTESEKNKVYIYKATNLITNKSVTLSKRKKQMTTFEIDSFAQKVRGSQVCGKSAFAVDVTSQDRISDSHARTILKRVFTEILPKFGFVVREKQVELAEQILTAITSRKIALAEAGVGIGKTYAYLVAAILAKRGRVNDFWLRRANENCSYAESASMPIVISTSSIALQNAIVQDYIPKISDILLKSDLITEPLTAVIRKGKEHYVCEKNLDSYYSTASLSEHALLLGLVSRRGIHSGIDLDSHPELSKHIKSAICVSDNCRKRCKYNLDGKCRYTNLMESLMSNKHEFQVCNHNYFLADATKRASAMRR